MNQRGDEKRSLFPSTQWAEVASAGQLDSPAGLAALDRLLRRYQPALKIHLRAKYGLDDHAIDDLFQEFTAEKILKNGLITGADPRRGKFRNYLLTALDRFFLNQVRKAQAQRRLPEQGFVPWEEIGPAEIAAETPHPASVFEDAWALQIMEEVQERMQAECRDSGRSDIWEVFAGRVLRPLLEDSPPIPYEELVARYGYASPDQAGHVLITGKRMFARNFRAIVAEYTLDAEAVEQEMIELKQILSRRRAWFVEKPGNSV